MVNRKVKSSNTRCFSLVIFLRAFSSNLHLLAVHNVHVYLQGLNYILHREFITTMFTEDYPGIAGKPLKFYGNDGVCLFKYFTDSSDSQRGFTIGKYI